MSEREKRGVERRGEERRRERREKRREHTQCSLQHCIGLTLQMCVLLPVIYRCGDRLLCSTWPLYHVYCCAEWHSSARQSRYTAGECIRVTACSIDEDRPAKLARVHISRPSHANSPHIQAKQLVQRTRPRAWTPTQALPLSSNGRQTHHNTLPRLYSTEDTLRAGERTHAIHS